MREDKVQLSQETGRIDAGLLAVDVNLPGAIDTTENNPIILIDAKGGEHG